MASVPASEEEPLAAPEASRVGGPALRGWFADDLDALHRPPAAPSDEAAAAGPAHALPWRDAVAFLQAVVGNSPDSIAVVTLDGRFLFMNRERGDLPPLRPGSSLWDYLAPAEHARVRDVLERVARTRVAERYDAVVPAPGAEVLYETRVGPIVEGDDVVALALVSSDVTALRRQGRELAASQETLRFAIEASGMAVWTFDTATERLAVDARLAAMTGVPVGAHAIAELALRVPPADRRAVTDALRRCIETGVYPDLEHRVLRDDGSLVWLHTKGRAVRDAGGRVVRVIGGSFDVTAQVTEAERRERAQKLEAVGQLAAGVAHNFNNALASMQLNLEFALRRSPVDVQPALRDALESGHRAAELVRELLRFAGHSHRSDLRAPERLDEIAARVVSLCRRTFPGDVALELACAPEVPVLPLAVAQVEQVILNLLINAQHALEEVQRARRWVRLSVDVVPGDAPEVQRHEVPAAPSFVRLRVEDNGCGMSEETQSRIFEPFFTTKIPGRGTGLGLATAWTAARDHGGWLECASTHGEGAVFSVYFPVRGGAGAPGGAPR